MVRTAALVPLAALGAICVTARAEEQLMRDSVVRERADPPLTGDQRMRLLRISLLSPGAILGSVAPAVAWHLRDSPSEWEQNRGGLAKRLGSQFAMQSTRGLLDAGASAALGRDPRYQRCGCKGGLRRAGHALSGLVLAADRTGARRVNPSKLIAAYGSGYVGASLYPERYTFGVKGYQLGNQQAAQMALQNLVLEFGPDVGRFLKKHVLRRR